LEVGDFGGFPANADAGATLAAARFLALEAKHRNFLRNIQIFNVFDIKAGVVREGRTPKISRSGAEVDKPRPISMKRRGVSATIICYYTLKKRGVFSFF
jgi:hypothetical protein